MTRLARLTLMAHNQQFVTGSARLTSASKRLLRLQPLYLLTDIELEDGTFTDHVWIQLDPFVNRQLRRGERFAFRGRVLSYRRRDGALDYTLTQVRVRG